MSTLNVTSIQGRAGSTPTFPDGAIVSGIATIGADGIDLTGGINVTGIATAKSLTLDGAISGVSSVTATTFYGSGANITSLPLQSPVFTGIASGTMPANRAVCVHSDGKVGVITGTKAIWGDHELASGSQPISDFRDASIAEGGGKIVVCYKIVGGSGRCIVGTRSGTTITWGTHVEFEAGITGRPNIIYNVAGGNFVISYCVSSTGQSRVVTISGTVPSFGTKVQFRSNGPERQKGTYIGGGKFALATKTGGNQGYLIVGSVSGTTITFGTEVEYTGNACDYPGIFWADVPELQNKFISFIKDGGTGTNASGTNNGQIRLNSVSGTTITLGPNVQPCGNQGITDNSMCWDTLRSKLIFIGYNSGNTYLRSVVGTISSGSITFGTPLTVEPNTVEANRVVYDPAGNKYILIYRDTTLGQVIYRSGTMAPADAATPTAITWSGITVINDINASSFIDMTGNANAAIMIYGSTSSYDLTYRVEQYMNSTLNSAGDNYIGFSDAAYTNGQTASIKIVGNVATGQVGLTTGDKYYIRGDGSLTGYYITNVDPGPNVLSGIAVGADKLLIK